MGLAPDRHPPEVVAAPAARGAGFAPRAALSPARVRTRGRARGAPKGQPDAGRCRLHARARRDPEGRLGAAPAAAGHVFLVPSFPSGARSLRLPHSPDAAPAAPGLGLLPPPSLRSPTPEALREGRESAELGPPEPPAPLPPPPRAWQAARDARCLVERPGRGLEPGRHWRPRPARRPRSPIGREQPRGAHLRPHTWGGPEVAALACAPAFGERR